MQLDGSALPRAPFVVPFVYFKPEQIDPVSSPGRHSTLLYRRIRFEDLGYDGIVRYRPELEKLVPDVRGYIAEWLDREASRIGHIGLTGRLYSPVEIPLPGEQ
jgi:hypothetical protein